MFKVALTGGIASGKTAVSDLFAQLGVTVIDADVIARQVVEPGSDGLAELINTFGNGILNTDGSLNRAAMRSKVFSDEDARSKVNSILHPRIRTEMHHQIESANSDYVVCVIPLLVETQQQSFYDRVLVVTAGERTRIQRLMTRDNCNEAQAQAILRAQVNDEARLKIADDVIDNSGSHDKLKKAVVQLHERYLGLSQANHG